MSKVDSCTDLLEALLYLFIMIFFGLLLNEVFFWLGLIGFTEVVVISHIKLYMNKKEEKERENE